MVGGGIFGGVKAVPSADRCVAQLMDDGSLKIGHGC